MSDVTELLPSNDKKVSSLYPLSHLIVSYYNHRKMRIARRHHLYLSIIQALQSLTGRTNSLLRCVKDDVHPFVSELIFLVGRMSQKCQHRLKIKT